MGNNRLFLSKTFRITLRIAKITEWTFFVGSMFGSEYYFDRFFGIIDLFKNNILKIKKRRGGRKAGLKSELKSCSLIWKIRICVVCRKVLLFPDYPMLANNFGLKNGKNQVTKNHFAIDDLQNGSCIQYLGAIAGFPSDKIHGYLRI